MRIPKRSLFAVAALAALVSLACTATKDYQKAVDDANNKGKYKVKLTTNPESVVGICKFVTTIEPEHDIVGGVPASQYPDYFRVQAVLAGADTVLVREGKLGEAYICGPSALNPDGTPMKPFDTPAEHP